MQNTDRRIKQQEIIIAENKTNHILHLLLSIFTGGLWLIVWLFVGMNNAQRRDEAQQEISSLLEQVPYLHHV